MSEPPNLFPDDYPIETLRGARKPGRRQVYMAMAQRARWLVERIAMDARLGKPHSMFVHELAAIAMLIDLAVWPDHQAQPLVPAEVKAFLKPDAAT